VYSYYHRDTENTEAAQRRMKLGHYRNLLVLGIERAT